MTHLDRLDYQTIMIITQQKPRFRKAIAFFDYDWTIVKPKSNGTFPKDVDDWEWLRPSVPYTIKNLYKKGFAIVVVTNQSKDWKVTQIEKVLELLNIPMTICIARDKADYKPSLNLLNEAFSPEKQEKIDKKKSFFCGDALGRPMDYDDTDKRFAEALGVRVMPPEDLFPRKEPDNKVEIKVSKDQELVIMVGMPGSGKTTFVNETFGQSEYVIASGDELKTAAKLLKCASAALEKGKSVVIDATNPSKQRREDYINLAKKHNVHVKVVYVNTPMEESMARNNKREKPVPRIAYSVYNKNFEMPTTEEGCEVVVL